jgi:uncharacterized delta-60 repeat protein
MAGQVGAASLSVDTNFQPPFFAAAIPAERALLLPDGKYFLFFDPDTLTDQPTGPLTRFLSDGTLDTSFNFSRDYKQVRAVAPTGPDKFYVAATRYAYGTKDTDQILRINNDGSIDPTFTPAVVSTADKLGFVYNLYVQLDGKLLAVGYFDTVSGVARVDIVRLMPDGTVDPDFIPATVEGGEAYAITLQPDQKIIVGGNFQAVNGTSSLGVARLNPNGSVDSSFQASGWVPTARVRCLAVQNDGSVIVSGGFRIGSGFSAKRMQVVRLNSSGVLDSTFDSSGIFSSGTARDFVIQPDGKIVATDNSTVIRLNTNGSFDNSFHVASFQDGLFVPPTSNGTPVSLNRYNDGKLLVGGIFTDVDPPGAPNYAHFGVVRLNSDGTVDSSLVSSHHTGNETAPSSFGRLDDGSTLVSFRGKLDPAVPYNFGRLLPNGSRDSSFTLSSSDPSRFLANFGAQGFEPLPDGKFFVYGFEQDFNTMAYGKIASNGVEDTTFAATNNTTYFQTATAAPDGKILLAAGNEPAITVYASLSRLQADGQPDTLNIADAIHDYQIERADSGGSGNGTIFTIYAGSRVLAVQSDGTTLYEYLRNDGRFHLLQIDPSGSQVPGFTETTFDPTDLSENFPVIFDPVRAQTYQPPGGAWTASYPLLDAHVQANGSTILVGQFKSFGGAVANSIVRVKPNGALDNTFNPGAGPHWTSVTETATLYPKIENIESLPDGKFVITGNFEAFDGTPAPGIAVLNADGSVDTSFTAPVERDKRSRLESALKRQADGSFLLSGPYKIVGQSVVRSFIRLTTAQPGAVNISTRLRWDR